LDRYASFTDGTNCAYKDGNPQLSDIDPGGTKGLMEIAEVLDTTPSLTNNGLTVGFNVNPTTKDISGTWAIAPAVWSANPTGLVFSIHVGGGQYAPSGWWWDVDQGSPSGTFFVSCKDTDGCGFSNAKLWGVSEVPIPAAAWLFGSGLIGLVGIARKRKSA
jgi:hypothetical protein